MSSTNGRPKLSEKGLLTLDRCIVTLLDLQPQMIFGAASIDRQTLVNNTLVLAKAARAKPVTALSVMLEWQRDWTHKGTYDAVMDIVKTHCGVYGAGVEYGYTMVHGASPTAFPD